MELVVARENMRAALERAEQNRGAPGVDGMRTDELRDWLKQHWPEVRAKLLDDAYRPRPVRRVEIPKPGGGVRPLGIPTVLDRLIQQALLEVLTPVFDPAFSEHSYGFRPGRSAHDAVEAARRYVEEGYGWVVDLDIEKFFDRVDHDVLTARVARRVRDKRVLRLIRRYLQAGVMVEGVAVRTDEGTPQGGPLGPPFANVLLDELDKEPERRVEDIEGWLHRRLRACVGKQWKRPHTRYRELRALGLPAWAARQYAGSRRGFWRMAGGPLNQALPRSYWQRQGLLDLVDSYRRLRYA